MVIIEIFVYVSIAAMMAFYANVMRKKGLLRKLDLIYLSVLLTLILLQLIIIALTSAPLLPQTEDSDPPIILICIGAILALALIYVITRIVESSTEAHEYARKLTLTAMFIMLGASFLGILIWLPETGTDLYRTPFALALCIGMVYYPPVLDRITRVNEAAETRTVERNVERHKDVIISLAIESWHFAKNYERAITRLNTDRTQRYTRQLEQFIQKAEESLEKVGLRIVNVEGTPYDPGMAATPLNIEDFGPEDQLVVDKMLEPIIMEGTVLAKTGTVTLRRVE